MKRGEERDEVDRREAALNDDTHKPNPVEGAHWAQTWRKMKRSSSAALDTFAFE